MNLLQLLARNADARDDDALVFLGPEGTPRASMTWPELYGAVATTAAGLREAGCRARAVPLVFEPGPDFTIAMLACLAECAVAVPLPPIAGARAEPLCRQLAELIRETDADLVLTSGASAEAIGEHLPDTGIEMPRLCDVAREGSGAPSPEGDPDAIAALLYTSGSTAAPKGVTIRHRHLFYNAESCCRQWGIDRDSVLISWMPNQHSFGMIYNVLLPLYSGARAVMTAPADFVRDPSLWLRAVDRYRGTHGAAATFGYQRCVDGIEPGSLGSLDLSCWRVGLISAEPVRRGTCEAFLQRFARFGLPDSFFCALYGLSETGPVTSMPVETPIRFHTHGDNPPALDLAALGPAMPGCRVAIAGPDGDVLAEGQTGEVWVASPALMDGYRHRETVNREVLIEREGTRWFKTGDQGLLCDGSLIINGRIKEMILYRGKNIFPSDLEHAARAGHADLTARPAAAFALSEIDEHRIAVVIEAPKGRSDADYGALARGAARRIAAETGVAVDRVVLVAPGSVPVTASGKIRRGACRDSLAELPVLLSAQPSDSACEEQPRAVLVEVLAEILHLSHDELEFTVPLAEYELDSMSFVALAEALGRRLDIDLEPALLYQCVTPEDLVALLERSRSS